MARKLHYTFWAAAACLNGGAAGLEAAAGSAQRGLRARRAGQEPAPQDVMESLRTRIVPRVLRVPVRSVPEAVLVPEPASLVKSTAPVMMVSKGTIKSKRQKVEFNPFKDMISNINLAINNFKDEFTEGARDLVHEARDTLQDAGKQLSSEHVLSPRNKARGVEGTSLLAFPEPNETVAAILPRSGGTGLDDRGLLYAMSNALPEPLDPEAAMEPVTYGNSRPRPRPQ
mmetsp:Transcript_79396/g.246231  ORF Transcript_79396/g.246231 Transcript_79396/m.246231 type:complete len:228 (-) Transcript_79396:115-798(-)